MKDIDLCRDCQKERPAFIGGRMYKRCLDCLQAYDAKLAANREERLRTRTARIYHGTLPTCKGRTHAGEPCSNAGYHHGYCGMHESQRAREASR